MPKHVFLAAGCFLLVAGLAGEARTEKIPYANSQIKSPAAEWTAKIQSLAPAKPTVDAVKRKVLVFSLFTGFKHDVVPYVDRVFEVLGKKSGAMDAARTVDIEALTPQGLAPYDVLVLNNNCYIRNFYPDRWLAGDPPAGAMPGLRIGPPEEFARRETDALRPAS